MTVAVHFGLMMLMFSLLWSFHFLISVFIKYKTWSMFQLVLVIHVIVSWGSGSKQPLCYISLSKKIHPHDKWAPQKMRREDRTPLWFLSLSFVVFFPPPELPSNFPFSLGRLALFLTKFYCSFLTSCSELSAQSSLLPLTTYHSDFPFLN